MSEEEKKALIELKKQINTWDYDLDTLKNIKTILDVIEKQQKEIKSLTDENHFLKEMYRGTTEYKAIKKKVEELGWN